MRPVTIEDTRVVTHEAAACEARAETDRPGGFYARLEAAEAENASLRARLASAETALADRDRHFLWDDRLRMEREVGALSLRLATAEAERDQWQRRAEWLSTSTDEVCYVEPVGDYEGGWHILAVPGFYATRWEAIDAATRRAPSTGGTP